MGWFEGHLWWIGVAVGAGLIVGVLRRVLHMPQRIPGLIEDLESEHIETRWVPSIVAVSAVSLLGVQVSGPKLLWDGWVAAPQNSLRGVVVSMKTIRRA